MFDLPDYEDHGNSAMANRRHKHSTIDTLEVYVYSFDQSLNLDTDESYTLTVCPKSYLFHAYVLHASCQHVHMLHQGMRFPQDLWFFLSLTQNCIYFCCCTHGEPDMHIFCLFQV